MFKDRKTEIDQNALTEGYVRKGGHNVVPENFDRPPPPPPFRPALACNGWRVCDMTRGLPTVSLHLEEAHSALVILRGLLAEQLHDDRKQFDAVVDRATNAIDRALDLIGDVHAAGQRALERL